MKLTSYTKYVLGLTVLLGITAYIIYKYNSGKLEGFNISPFNTYEVNKNTLEIQRQINLSEDYYSSSLKNEFKNESTSFKESNKIYAKDFTLRKLLENIVKDDLNNRFADNKVEVSEIEEIGWYENTDDNSVIFNFNINIINRKIMWVIPVKAWVKLNITNVCEKIDGCVETVSQLIRDNLINVNDIAKNFKLVNIVKDDFKKYEIQPIDPISPNYFQIKNTLHLTEPFLTSGEEMRLKNVDIN